MAGRWLERLESDTGGDPADEPAKRRAKEPNERSGNPRIQDQRQFD